MDVSYRSDHLRKCAADQYGKYLWIEIMGVEVIGIDNYHGK